MATRVVLICGDSQTIICWMWGLNRAKCVCVCDAPPEGGELGETHRLDVDVGLPVEARAGVFQLDVLDLAQHDGMWEHPAVHRGVFLPVQTGQTGQLWLHICECSMKVWEDGAAKVEKKSWGTYSLSLWPFPMLSVFSVTSNSALLSRGETSRCSRKWWAGPAKFKKQMGKKRKKGTSTHIPSFAFCKHFYSSFKRGMSCENQRRADSDS